MTAELVFIHGWGFDARFWDVLAPLLPQFKQHRIDLGFFGTAQPDNAPNPPRILVGHSLGFVHGIAQGGKWDGWIAINSFPRFVKTENKIGCSTAAELRDIRTRLNADAQKSLDGFHQYIGSRTPAGTPDAARLLQGLDELRDSDVKERLGDLSVPGLALCGGNDALVPKETSESLGRLARNGGLKMRDVAGHILPQTEPGWCAREITDFANMYFD